MQSSTSSAAVTVSAEPLFATVTFIGEDNAQGNTFRVPLSGATTVRRLAKDAMQRLVLSRRHLGASRYTPAIVVTEVFVGGTGGQPKAEIFAQDLVTQVILVKEEVVFMRLRTVEASSRMRRSASPPPPPAPFAAEQSVLPVPSVILDELPAPKTHSTLTLPVAEAQPRAFIPESAGGSKGTSTAECETTASPFPSDSTMSSDSSRATADEPCTTTAASSSKTGDAAASVSKMKTSVTAQQLRRPGWGPQAHTLFSDNYVSTPGKRQRSTQQSKKAASKQPEKRSKHECGDHEADGAAATVAEVGQRMVAPSTQEDKHLRWGPEASRHFAENYVSSPGKFARSRRSTAPAGPQVKAPAAAPLLAPKAPVSRTLQYPAADAETGRRTVGHTVEDAIDVEDVTAKAPLPKGWGVESLKFFDPETYCDDPKKARLQPHMNFPRPQRHRRPASP